MANVFDVAEYILQKKKQVSAMKLQKLCYYSQAWHATWEEKPLFDECIEAWANGPVIPDLYNKHRGKFLINIGDIEDGNPENLTAAERDNVDRVLAYYGDKDSQWLSDLTHAEDPWSNARIGIPSGERSNKEITLDLIVEYYGSL